MFLSYLAGIRIFADLLFDQAFAQAALNTLTCTVPIRALCLLKLAGQPVQSRDAPAPMKNRMTHMMIMNHQMSLIVRPLQQASSMSGDDQLSGIRPRRDVQHLRSAALHAATNRPTS